MQDHPHLIPIQRIAERRAHEDVMRDELNRAKGAQKDPKPKNAMEVLAEQAAQEVPHSQTASHLA